MVVEWLAPLAGMMMTAFIVWTVVWYFVKKAEFQSRPDADFRRLAQEAVRSQQMMAEETKKLASSVKEIQQLMSKV